MDRSRIVFKNPQSSNSYSIKKLLLFKKIRQYTNHDFHLKIRTFPSMTFSVNKEKSERAKERERERERERGRPCGQFLPSAPRAVVHACAWPELLCTGEEDGGNHRAHTCAPLSPSPHPISDSPVCYGYEPLRVRTIPAASRRTGSIRGWLKSQKVRSPLDFGPEMAGD